MSEVYYFCSLPLFIFNRRQFSIEILSNFIVNLNASGGGRANHTQDDFEIKEWASDDEDNMEVSTF